MTKEEAINRFKGIKESFSISIAQSKFYPSKDIQDELCDMAIKSMQTEAEWIPCSERLPKENEHVGNVCKYYLIQDEYRDMHVAHLSGRGWEPIESIKALGCDVLAWMPLPKPYRVSGNG